METPGKTSAVQAARTNAAASPPNARPGPLGGRSVADDARVSYASATAGLGARPQPCLLQLLLRVGAPRGEGGGPLAWTSAAAATDPALPQCRCRLCSQSTLGRQREGGAQGGAAGGGSRRLVRPATELYVPPQHLEGWHDGQITPLLPPNQRGVVGTPAGGAGGGRLPHATASAWRVSIRPRGVLEIQQQVPALPKRVHTRSLGKSLSSCVFV